jgi:UDP-3-O-[3-hydroxymyristoyl] glucosamine N-acyltransferase
MTQSRISVEDICRSIRMEHLVLGETEAYITMPSPINKANGESVSFCSKTGEAGQEDIRTSEAGVIVCSEHLQLTPEDYRNKVLILVSNPRLAFIRIMQAYFQEDRQYAISPTAIIDEEAELDPDVYIGPYTCIGKCRIGTGTVIYGNVYIYSSVKIGKNVVIHAGTVIGADGYSYERNEKGELEKFPHVGGVVIEDDVEIGSNTSIDRGTLGDTIIGKGTKIDDQSLIAHNVIIGKHCAITGQIAIGGSTKIGDFSWVAPSACLRDGITVGENTVIGMGSVVTKNIDGNCMVLGVPAKVVREVTSI